MTQEPNNNRIAEVRASLTAACPRESDRLIALRQLATSADTAGEIAPNAWAVSLLPDGFRLNVGQVEALVLVSGLRTPSIWWRTSGALQSYSAQFQIKANCIATWSSVRVRRVALELYTQVASDLQTAPLRLLIRPHHSRAPSGARKGTDPHLAVRRSLRRIDSVMLDRHVHRASPNKHMQRAGTHKVLGRGRVEPPCPVQRCAPAC